MATTRLHHFSSSMNLPDASLAVFFLAGLLLSWRWFPVFALLAGSIDYVAVTWGGVNAYCITPAYAFLIPTYGVMMLGGAWSRRFVALGISGMPGLLVVATLSATAAFSISNGSFYWYSGYFTGEPFVTYIAGTAKYYAPYLTSALAYIAACLAVIRFTRLLRSMQTVRT